MTGSPTAARQVLTGGTVLTMNARRDLIADAAIVLDGPVIAYVGAASGVRVEPADIRVDCRGLLLMPGLVNAHTHTAMGLYRGLAEDRPRSGWAPARYALPHLERARPEDYYHGALVGAVEMLLNGVTTIADRGGSMDVMAEALDAAGIRAVVAHTLHDIDRPLELERARRVLARWGTDPRARVHAGLGPHAPDTCSDALLRQVRALAGDSGARIYIHCAQSDLELATVRARGYAGAVHCLHGHGILGPDVVAAHCLYLGAGEIALLAATGTWVAHCPASIAPVAAMLAAGVGVALGTDWAPTNNTMDLFDEMKTAGLLGKVAADDAAAIRGSARTSWRWPWTNCTSTHGTTWPRTSSTPPRARTCATSGWTDGASCATGGRCTSIRRRCARRPPASGGASAPRPVTRAPAARPSASWPSPRSRWSSRPPARPGWRSA